MAQLKHDKNVVKSYIERSSNLVVIVELDWLNLWSKSRLEIIKERVTLTVTEQHEIHVCHWFSRVNKATYHLDVF